MALALINISTNLVGNEIGNSSRNVGILCTAPEINQWSRARPGYLYIDGTTKEITYHPPAGHATTDPRGANPDTNSLGEDFNLGDFRGYNHSAVTPDLGALPDIIYASSQAGLTVSRTLTFYIGEVNWANSGTIYRELNNFLNLLYANVVDNSTLAVIGGAALSGIALNGSIDVSFSYTLPAAGNTIALTVFGAFGIDATHWSAKLGNRSFNATVLLAALITGTQWDGSAISGGTTPPYSGLVFNTQGNYLSAGNILHFVMSDLAPFQVLNGSSVIEYFHEITADVWVKGFYGQSSTEYLIGTALSLFGNSADNAFTLPAGLSPSTYGDGDVLTLVLKNVNLIY